MQKSLSRFQQWSIVWHTLFLCLFLETELRVLQKCNKKQMGTSSMRLELQIGATWNAALVPNTGIPKGPKFLQTHEMLRKRWPPTEFFFSQKSLKFSNLPCNYVIFSISAGIWHCWLLWGNKWVSRQFPSNPARNDQLSLGGGLPTMWASLSAQLCSVN